MTEWTFVRSSLCPCFRCRSFRLGLWTFGGMFPLQRKEYKLSSVDIIFTPQELPPCVRWVVFSKMTITLGLWGLRRWTGLIGWALSAFYLSQHFKKICGHRALCYLFTVKKKKHTTEFSAGAWKKQRNNRLKEHFCPKESSPWVSKVPGASSEIAAHKTKAQAEMTHQVGKET